MKLFAVQTFDNPTTASIFLFREYITDVIGDMNEADKNISYSVLLLDLRVTKILIISDNINGTINETIKQSKLLDIAVINKDNITFVS